jgi:hypothetical protein
MMIVKFKNQYLQIFNTPSTVNGTVCTLVFACV